MAQNAGEMYVNLGLKGADSMIGGMGRIKEGLSDIKVMSIETKAAILAALAVFEKMVSTSGQLGTSLVNFQAISGIPIETLQRYQWTGIQSHTSKDAIEQAFLKTMNAATQTLAGQGLPPWLTPIMTSLAQHGDDVGPNWAQRWANDPTLGFQAAQKYALYSDIPKSTRLFTLEQAFPGIPPEALMRGDFTQGRLGTAPPEVILNQQEAGRLDKARQLWDRVWARAGGTVHSTLAGRGIDEDLKFIHGFKEGFERRLGDHRTTLHFHQTVNVHGNAHPAQVKKAAADGGKDAANSISQSFSSQTSH